MMIYSFVQFWFFSAVIFANPIPQSLYDVTGTDANPIPQSLYDVTGTDASPLDADPSKNLEDSISTPDEQIIENSHFSPSIKCSSMDENLNGKDLKKLPGVCPVTYSPTGTPLSRPILKKEGGTSIPDEMRTRTTADRLCTLTHKNHLSCGGPKVEMVGMMVLLNCLTGTATRIPKRGRFEEADLLGGFCCGSRDAPDMDSKGLFRGKNCIGIPPYVRMETWAFSYYEMWRQTDEIYRSPFAQIEMP